MMRQYYYTSTRQGPSGSAGFQCKAKSPGFSAEDVRIINNMIGYRIPPTMNETDIATHPCAFRYTYISSDKCVLVNSQSNGPDENGRPGNFFAHAIMTQPEDFQIFPPIMFWRNKFWKSEDHLDRTDLPEAQAFNVEPSLDLDQMWSFLQNQHRREWFRSLLAAVVRYDTDKRPIIILDDSDHVALWIAAITLALPGSYRPFLSFATYHHDPYQTPYRITGTTHDSRFRFSSDEYTSHFVLNVDANRISQVGESEYANFVAENFDPTSFEDKLLDFFAMCSDRLPNRHPKNLDSILDAATRYYLTFREGRIPLSSSEAQDSLTSYLSYVEGETVLEENDIEEITHVADTLLQSLANDTSPLVLQNYSRLLNLLKRHDRGFRDRCPRDLVAWLHTLTMDVVAAERHLQVLEQAYGAQLRECVSSGGFPATLSASLNGLPWKAHQLVWGRVVPLFNPEPQSKRAVEALLAQALSICNQMTLPGQNQPNPEALSLMRIIIGGSNQSKSFMLNTATDWYQKTGGAAFLWFYYELVQGLPLSERSLYRKDIQRVAPDIVFYEISQDSRSSRLEDQGLRLTEWLNHLKNEPGLEKHIVSTWLDARWVSASQPERKQIADQILISEDISVHLEQTWQTQLLNSFLTGLTLKRLSSDVIKLYERFSTYGGLNIHQKALITGSLAITKRAFPQGSIPIIHEWLSSMDSVRYQTEVAKFIEAFFSKGVTTAAHADMLKAVYSVRHEEAFWSSYWMYFQSSISDIQRLQESADLLSFWFEESVIELQNCQYLVPSFFLEFPAIIEENSNEKSSQRSMKALAQHISRKEWFPSIEGYFVRQKGGLRGLLSRK